MKPSDYDIKTITQRLENLLGYPPKKEWVVNLAFEMQCSLSHFSDLELLQHYRAIEKLHS
jgi:hypothetical protein